MKCIDPSVADERDPMSVDPALDPFADANGFKAPPASASYAPDFVTRYRAAQEQRVARLDGSARALIEERLAARKRGKESGARADRIKGAHTPVMAVWRTDADLRCWDLQLDPSERRYGSVWGRDPFASNYGAVGFARFCTPEAWLSTWSGLSSRADMQETLKSIEQPVLMIEYTGDNTIFPSDLERLYGAIPSPDKRRLSIRGDHHGRALEKGEAAGRDKAGAEISAWLQPLAAR
jgi:pimeloyl-ACP methyl ester carboxylesterase